MNKRAGVEVLNATDAPGEARHVRRKQVRLGANGRRAHGFRPGEMIVITVALHGNTPCLTNRVLEGFTGLFLRRLCSRHMEDFFAHDRAMEIVHAIGQRDLRERQSEAYPISGQMLDVIEVDAADREVAQLLESSRTLDVGEDSRLSAQRQKE